MVQLAFLLLGAEAVRRQWVLLGLVGVIWASLGVIIITQAIEHVHGLTIHVFGLLLMAEGLVAIFVRLCGYRSQFWALKALGLLVPGLSIVETPFRNLMVISILFGIALMIDSVVRTLTLLVVRFTGWRIALIATSIEFVLALLAITPWPVSYEATIPFCISIALILSGWTVVRSALRLHRLPLDAPVTSLPLFEHERGWHSSVLPPMLVSAPGSQQQMVVHVWTAWASAVDPVRRPLIDRYIAAVDRHGTVSTGHAALEMGPLFYISHYNADDAERSPAQFRRALHAGEQNNVSGRFLTSYREEVESWCEATVHVSFAQFNVDRLTAFWDAYRKSSTYNLTNRNCSVAVALALDAALEGVLAPKMLWPPLMRLLINPELYLATLLRRRAQTMTWTPGLVLDYARALKRVVEPPPLPWPMMIAHTALRWRRIRAQRHAQARIETASSPNPAA